MEFSRKWSSDGGVPCAYFMNGFCRKGNHCNFYHPPTSRGRGRGEFHQERRTFAYQSLFFKLQQARMEMESFTNVFKPKVRPVKAISEEELKAQNTKFKHILWKFYLAPGQLPPEPCLIVMEDGMPFPAKAYNNAKDELKNKIKLFA